jgi:hypothetical protein
MASLTRPALILTDPPVGQISSGLSPIDVVGVHYFQPDNYLSPSISSSNTILQDSSKWKSPERSPSYLLMLDGMLLLMGGNDHHNMDENPLSCTVTCENLRLLVLLPSSVVVILTCSVALSKTHIASQHIVSSIVLAGSSKRIGTPSGGAGSSRVSSTLNLVWENIYKKYLEI